MRLSLGLVRGVPATRYRHGGTNEEVKERNARSALFLSFSFPFWDVCVRKQGAIQGRDEVLRRKRRRRGVGRLSPLLSDFALASVLRSLFLQPPA